MLGRELLRIPGRVAGTRERPDRDVVGPDVVRVPVAAEVVVGRDDVGLVAADEPDQPAGGLVQVGLPEAARVAVPGPTHHVRVVVAEVLPLGHAEDAHRRLELGGPELAEPAVVVRGVHLGHDDLAHLAARAGDQDDPTARRRRPWPSMPPVPIVSSSGWAWTVIRVGRWPVGSVVMVKGC